MKFLLPALLLIATESHAVAQELSFLLPRNLLIGTTGCCSVLTGDFNGDGKTDIAVAHGVAGITVLLGDGKGGFSRTETAQGLPQGSMIRTLVAAADINSDGILDILAIADIGSVAIIGRRDGSFQTPIALGVDPLKAVADFNGDGKPDLLVYSGFQPGENFGFAIRFGNGDGTFRSIGPVTQLPRGDYAWVVVADFNRDGKADVAQSSFRPGTYTYVEVWLGNGDGTFGNVEEVQTSFVGAEPGQIAVGDLNGDGKIDLVAFVDTVGVVVLLGNGDGTFQTGKTYPVHDGFAAPMVVGDLNGDGFADVALGFTILLGNGDGTLGTPAVFGQFYVTSHGPLYGINETAIADFNSDGKPDLVGATPDGVQLSILINNSPNTDASVPALSAASYYDTVAPGSIASIFGKDLAETTAFATGLPLPVVLAGTRVRILDPAGVERFGELIYVSPTQINFVVPPETPAGQFSYTIFNFDNGKSPLVLGARSTLVQSLAPGLFTVDGTGQGLAAATAVRVLSDGTQSAVPVFQCSANNSCQPLPIDLSGDGTVYLSLYGTGFAHAASANCSRGKFPNNDLVLPSSYAGPQGQDPGLDQINLVLPKILTTGRLDIYCILNDAARASMAEANLVTIYIK